MYKHTERESKLHVTKHYTASRVLRTHITST